MTSVVLFACFLVLSHYVTHDCLQRTRFYVLFVDILCGIMKNWRGKHFDIFPDRIQTLPRYLINCIVIVGRLWCRIGRRTLWWDSRAPNILMRRPRNLRITELCSRNSWIVALFVRIEAEGLEFSERQLWLSSQIYDSGITFWVNLRLDLQGFQVIYLLNICTY